MSGLHRSSSSSKNVGNCLPSKELLDDLCRFCYQSSVFFFSLSRIKWSDGLELISVTDALWWVFGFSRFVLNVPEEDQQSFERILFLVEYAYWYYEDNSVENDPSLKSLSLKEFTSLCILSHSYFVARFFLIPLFTVKFLIFTSRLCSKHNFKTKCIVFPT